MSYILNNNITKNISNISKEEETIQYLRDQIRDLKKMVESLSTLLQNLTMSKFPKSRSGSCKSLINCANSLLINGNSGRKQKKPKIHLFTENLEKKIQKDLLKKKSKILTNSLSKEAQEKILNLKEELNKNDIFTNPTNEILPKFDPKVKQLQSEIRQIKREEFRKRPKPQKKES